LGGIVFSGNYALPTSRESQGKSEKLSPEQKSLFHPIRSEDGISEFGNEYSISFSFYLMSNKTNGDIFLLKKEKYSISLSYEQLLESSTANFIVKINGKPTPIISSYKLSEIYEGNSITFKMDVDETKRIVAVRIGLTGEKNKIYSKEIVASEKSDLIFGTIQPQNNCLPLILKELKIFSNKDLLHYWQFREMSGDIAYDEVGGLETEVKNCEWLINKHYFYEPIRWIKHVSPENYIKIGAEPEQVIVTKKGVKLANLRRRIYTIIKFPEDKEYITLNHSLTINDSLMAFHTGYPDKPGILNFRTGRWLKQIDKITLDGYNYGSYPIMDPRNNSIYIFGGYGWYRFKNTLLKYNDNLQKWDTCVTSGEKPMPLYSYSILRGSDDTEYYIMGGLGVPSGKQEDGQRPFWQIFKLDLKNMYWEKVWAWHSYTSIANINNAEWGDQNRNLIYCVISNINPETKFGNLQRLGLLSMRDSNVSFVGDFLPGNSNSLETNPLIVDYETGILYTSDLSSNEKEIGNQIYSIKLPILTKLQYDELFDQSPPERQARFKKFSIFGFLMLILLVLINGIFFYYRKKKLLQNEVEVEPLLHADTTQIQNNYLTLFGGLSIIDNNGKSLHSFFTPQQAEMFSLMLYYSNKPPHLGVTFAKITSVFWDGTQNSKIKNNRNVAFTKFRNILKNFEGISLETGDETAKIVVSEEITDEVRDFFRLVQPPSKPNDSDDTQFAKEFMRIVSRGEMLSNISSEWAKELRTETVALILKKALKFLSILYKREAFADCVKMSDIILVHESLSEAALRYKIKSLISINKRNVAEQEFNVFRKVYYKKYGENFAYSFEEFSLR
jgi:two-component SAPR family response regulator